MNRLPKKILRLWLASLLLFASISASAQIDCQTLPHWVTLNNGSKLNQQHIFCGEWNQNRPKGFHSRPGGANPSTVYQFTVQSKPNAAGIYTGRWSYKNHTDKNKFSSMFPDRCTASQVLNSITHAVTNSGAQCPPGSPDWIHCGLNKPETNDVNDDQFCHHAGKFFTIGFAPPKGNKINTAFPIFE